MSDVKSKSRLYGRRWNKARLAYLAKHPLCVMCKKLGRTTAASVVDHITPHKDDAKLFWDSKNWQALCKHCHDSTKQAQEKSGFVRGAAADGTPLDPDHHWNR